MADSNPVQLDSFDGGAGRAEVTVAPISSIHSKPPQAAGSPTPAANEPEPQQMQSDVDDHPRPSASLAAFAPVGIPAPVRDAERFNSAEKQQIKDVIGLCGGMLITPRKLKRILNIYPLQRAIMKAAGERQAAAAKAKQQDPAPMAGAEMLLRWTFLAELWPVRFACLMHIMETVESPLESTRGLRHLYEYTESGQRCGLGALLDRESSGYDDAKSTRYKDCQRLLALDGDGPTFLKLLQDASRVARKELTVGRVCTLSLHKLTINLNPALRTEITTFMLRATCVDGKVVEAFAGLAEQAQDMTLQSVLGLAATADVADLFLQKYLVHMKTLQVVVQKKEVEVESGDFRMDLKRHEGPSGASSADHRRHDRAHHDQGEDGGFLPLPSPGGYCGCLVSAPGALAGAATKRMGTAAEQVARPGARY
ncbi:hypothetical protein JKP88DRAFT_268637 [Tribonema minus]|uniref:Uncharacterized protein n=1 Tax=Tribonema minus TaxID=303371 RepID=A0A835YZB8_9STRA|nr:hypothetical protein JKP88DRAFT_268637 [Tribonema minus]